MKSIYEGPRHRDWWSWLFLFIGALLTAAGTCVLTRSQLSIATMIGLGIAGAGAALLILEWRFYRRMPLDVYILDNKAVQVRAKHGTYTYDANQIAVITYTFDRGKLFLNANGLIWHLPCHGDEAEKVIEALVSLNPALEIRRQEDGFCG